MSVTRSTHGREQAVLGEDLAVSGAGELTVPIGVDDEGSFRLPLPQGHAQSGDGGGNMGISFHIGGAAYFSVF